MQAPAQAACGTCRAVASPPRRRPPCRGTIAALWSARAPLAEMVVTGVGGRI